MKRTIGTQASTASRLLDPEEARADAVLHDEHEQAVGGGDREEVEQHGLKRQDERAERERQRREGDGQDRQDEPGERVVGAGDEVDALRGRPAGDDHRACREPRRGNQVVPEPADEPACLRGAEVVQRHDDDSRVAAARVDVRVAPAVRDGPHLGVGSGRVHEPEDRGPAGSGPGAARSARVDDDLGGGDDPRAEPVAKQLEPPDRLRPARDRRDRAGRHVERRRRGDGRQEDGEAEREDQPAAAVSPSRRGAPTRRSAGGRVHLLRRPRTRRDGRAGPAGASPRRRARRAGRAARRFPATG